MYALQNAGVGNEAQLVDSLLSMHEAVVQPQPPGLLVLKSQICPGSQTLEAAGVFPWQQEHLTLAPHEPDMVAQPVQVPSFRKWR